LQIGGCAGVNYQPESQRIHNKLAIPRTIGRMESSTSRVPFFFNCYSTFRGRGLFLEDLYVRAQFRGTRIGDALLARVADIALVENCFGIMMNVLDWNRPAIGFFRNHKVKFLDDWKTGCLDREALRATLEHP
jgi:GNAT superfamily N-acetyltransferase